MTHRVVYFMKNKPRQENELPTFAAAQMFAGVIRKHRDCECCTVHPLRKATPEQPVRAHTARQVPPWPMPYGEEHSN